MEQQQSEKTELLWTVLVIVRTRQRSKMRRSSHKGTQASGDQRLRGFLMDQDHPNAMLKISGLLAGLLLLAACASTKSELTAVRCDETIQGVGRDLSNGQQKIIYELEKTENANYLLDRDRQRVVRWLDGHEDTQTTMSDVVFLSDAVTWKTIEDPSPTGVEDASSRQVEDVVKLNLETLEIEGYARSEGSLAGEVVSEIEINTTGQCIETVIPKALLTSKAP